MASLTPEVTNTSAGVRVLRDRRARGEDAGRGRVAVVAVAQRALHRLDEVRRGGEVELQRVADVAVEHLEAVGFDARRLDGDVANRVTDVVDVRGGAEH